MTNSFHSVTLSITVEIGVSVLTRVIALSAKAHPKETGGILIGRISDDGRAAIVLEATAAPPDSKSTRTSFYRGTKGLQKLLTERWSCGESYLGEWHYHPNGSGDPSSPDVFQMLAIARSPKSQCPEPLLVVCGGNPDDIELRLFLINNVGVCAELERT